MTNIRLCLLGSVFGIALSFTGAHADPEPARLLMPAAAAPTVSQVPKAAALVEKYLANYKLLGKFMEYRGRMVIVGPDATANPHAYRISAEGEQLNVGQVTLHIEARLVVDAETLLPLSGSRTIKALAMKEPVTSSMERVGEYAISNLPFGDQYRFHLTLPSEPRDPLSTYFALRSLPLEEGDAVEMIVALELIGVSVGFYKAHFEVHRERVTLQSGSAPALRIRGHLDPIDRRGQIVVKGRHTPADFVFWLADTPNRELLRIEAEGYGLKVDLEPTCEAPPRLFPRRATLPGVTILKARGKLPPVLKANEDGRALR